jgi:hypothetical protein
MHQFSRIIKAVKWPSSADSIPTHTMRTSFISFCPSLCRAIVCTAATALLFSLAACKVRKTEEGEAPKVQVDPGKLPKYDVDTAKVQTTTEQKEVTVPKVTTEQKTITVPKVSVTMPGEPTPTPAAADSPKP